MAGGSDPDLQRALAESKREAELAEQAPRTSQEEEAALQRALEQSRYGLLAAVCLLVSVCKERLTRCADRMESSTDEFIPARRSSSSSGNTVLASPLQPADSDVFDYKADSPHTPFQTVRSLSFPFPAHLSSLSACLSVFHVPCSV